MRWKNALVSIALLLSFAAAGRAQIVTTTLQQTDQRSILPQQYAAATMVIPLQPGITNHQLTFTAGPGISAITVTVTGSKTGVNGSYSACGSSTTVGDTITCSGTFNAIKVVYSAITGTDAIDATYFGNTSISQHVTPPAGGCGTTNAVGYFSSAFVLTCDSGMTYAPSTDALTLLGSIALPAGGASTVTPSLLFGTNGFSGSTGPVINLSIQGQNVVSWSAPQDRNSVVMKSTTANTTVNTIWQIQNTAASGAGGNASLILDRTFTARQAAVQFQSAGTIKWEAGILRNGGGATNDFAIGDNAADIASGAPMIISNDATRISYITFNPPAHTALSNANMALVKVTPGGATTITGATTTPVAASLTIDEPNLTATGTVTLATSLHVSGSPTEGGTNYAAYIQGNTNSIQYSTGTNCTDSAGPAACGSATAGSIVMDAAATTVVVSTTNVTAASQIFITDDASLNSRLSVTCNTVQGRTYSVSARTAGTSFTITASAAPAANPACLSYLIIN